MEQGRNSEKTRENETRSESFLFPRNHKNMPKKDGEILYRDDSTSVFSVSQGLLQSDQQFKRMDGRVKRSMATVNGEEHGNLNTINVKLFF